MFIRSQDKKTLVPIGGIYIYKIAEGAKVNIMLDYGDSNSQNWTLGSYETTDRCIEILDEIQKKYSTYYSVDGGPSMMIGGGTIQPYSFVPPKVYEMPKK